MDKSYSNIVGMPVYGNDGPRPIAFVKGIVMDVERGAMLGLIVDKGKNLVIAPRDIVSFGHVVRVHNADCIIDGDEIIRIKEAQNKGVQILHNQVLTDNGEDLGCVYDFDINTNSGELKKLYTAKSLLGFFRYDSRVVSAKNIIEITADNILVKDSTKVKIAEGQVALGDAAAT